MPRVRTVPRKEPRQARSIATVDAILTATARVLTRDGYDHASTNKIAEEAGVSVGSLYQYFPSKEALVAALIDRHMAHLTGILEAHIAALGDASIPAATRTLVRVMIEAHSYSPKLHKIIAEQVPRVGRLDRSHDIEREIANRIRALLELRRGELRPENLELAVFLIVSVVEGLTHRAIIDNAGVFDVEEVTDEITAIVVRYVMKDPPG